MSQKVEEHDMTPTGETSLNPFIGSECGGRRGKVVMREDLPFTPTKAITVIPTKQRPFVKGDWPIWILLERNTATLRELTPTNADLLRIADRFPAPQEWYDE